MTFREQLWRRPRKRSSYRALVAYGIGGLVVGCLLGSTVFSGYLPNVLRWVGSFVVANGAAVATVAAAFVAFGGIAWQIGLARKTAQSNSWWQTFEWAAERAIPSKEGSIALPADTITSALNQLALDAPTDAQKQACSGIISLIVDRLDSQGHAASEPRSDRKDRDEREGDADQLKDGGGERRPQADSWEWKTSTLDSIDRVTKEYLGRADLSDRVRLALFAYSESTKGTAAASPSADALAYEARLFESLESALRVRNPAAYESLRTGSELSDGGWDASIGNLGPRRVHLLIKHTTDTGAIRSAVAVAARRQFDQRPDSALVVVAPTHMSNMPEGWLPENTYFASWNDDSDTASLIEAIRLAANT